MLVAHVCASQQIELLRREVCCRAGYLPGRAVPEICLNCLATF